MREAMKLRCAKCQHQFDGPMSGMVLARCARYLQVVHCPNCGVGCDRIIFTAPAASVEVKGEVT